MVFKIAFLQDTGRGKLRIEEQMLKSEFERRGTPVELYSIKRIQRRNLPLSTETFIAGDMDAMHGAMQQLKIDIPVPNDYPDCLAPFLHRRVWHATLGDVERRLAGDAGRPVFVKPSARRKNFTGRVFTWSGDFLHIGTVSRRQMVWCSDVVSWKSEFRVYVIGDEIVGTDHYAGDPEVVLDMGTVNAAIVAYRKSGQAPAAYGIDFGVLGTGETALVEVNDGYALGAYALAAKPYTDLLIKRWQELVQTAKADAVSQIVPRTNAFDEATLISRLNLASDDLEMQHNCLNEILAHAASNQKLSSNLKNALVQSLSKSTKPFLVAEKLALIAAQMEDELRALLDSDAALPVRVWTALLLLHVNVRAGVPLLLKVVESRGDSWYPHVAMKLAHANERSMIEIAVKGLHALDENEVDAIGSFLDVLRIFSEPLPAALLAKFSKTTTPWQIQRLLKLGNHKT